MLWMEKWRAWSARFDAISELVRLYASTSQYEFEDNAVILQLQAHRELLREFKDQFGQQLPPGADRALESYLQGPLNLMRFGRSIGIQGALSLVLDFGMAKAEVDYFLSDTQALARRASERAFEHLKRSLVVDEDIRRKWQAAFATREEQCEKLGALHMLLHGIWAFKAHSQGGRTDLILGDRVNDNDAMRTADAMVLTEWKVVRNKAEAAQKAQEAFSQAERYIGETLAGFELSTHRYLILVSEDFLKPVPMVKSPPGYTYVVRNIAVCPSTPSEESAAAT